MDNNSSILTDSKKIDTASGSLTEEILTELKNNPDASSYLHTHLYDLKSSTVKMAAELSDIDRDKPFVLGLVDYLPDYEAASFYRSRASLLSLGIAVLLGWLLGGFLSTILNLVSLGGDVLRPVSILAIIWLEDYLGSDPKARKILLTVLGLGGLGRFAASLASGLVRFTSLSSLRGLIFGSAPRAGFFKTTWMWIGALFLIAFFAKKPTGIDLAGLQASLLDQTKERLRLCMYILTQIHDRDDKIADLEHANATLSEASGRRNENRLALALLPMLDNMEPDAKKYLQSKLQEAGYLEENIPDGTLVWQNDRDRTLYTPIGMVKDGDTCKILRKPVFVDDKIIKGMAQRLPHTK